MSMRTAGASEATMAGGESHVPAHVTALETSLSLGHTALRVIAEAPRSTFDLRPAAASLADAITAITRGYEECPDPLSALRAASVSLSDARAKIEQAAQVDPPLTEVCGWLDGATEWLRVAEQRFARVPTTPRPFEDLVATTDTLRVHHFPRAPLRPFVLVPEPLPPPHVPSPPTPRIAPAKSFAELEERIAKLRAQARPAKAPDKPFDEGPATLAPPPEDRPGFSKGPHAARPLDRATGDKARECAEEVGMLGMQRAPLLGDPWRSAAIFETRMFTAIDAFASTGSAGIGSLEETFGRAPAKDPTRVFAALLLGGCLAGRDALAMGERVARNVGLGDDEVRRAAAGALALAPHRDLLPMLRAWANDSDAGARAVAFEVLRYRGLLTAEEALRAARDASPWVRAVGLRAASELRIDDLDALVADAFESDDVQVREAAYVAGLVGDVPYVADRIEKDLASPFEDKAILALAIGGTDERHADAVVARLREGLTPSRIFAVGWCGSVGALQPLLDGLKSGKLDVALASAFALERITGASLPEKVDLPPESLDALPEVDDPNIGDPPPPKPLAQQVSDPRDLPSDGSPDRVVAPSLRLDRWKAWLAREEKRFRPGARYRRGVPYTPAVSFTELDRFPLSPPERRWLHRELVIRTGQFLPFDPHDLVPVQEVALRAWAPHVERASSVGGSFGRARRRR